ncbi:lysine methyltransferase SET5 [Diaporthe amygdali]|uniref:lysine methyltransferase SET5 n=1 Tax=Phomopsis amygdali TaxID=1214568 RepID=UPI0022FDC807|nr:lysine methyltransferase SET5 [Diaporthe amygdali]KAJ0124499.1 lysine methyltransferase SET5 [Diaporthe amygdali]
MEFEDEVFPSQLEQLLPELQEDDPTDDGLKYDDFVSTLIGADTEMFREAIPARIRYLLDAVSPDDPLRGNPLSKPPLPSLKAGSVILDDPFVLSVQEPAQESASEEEAIELLSVVMIQLVGQYVRLPIETRRQLSGLHPHIRAGTRDWFCLHLRKIGVNFSECELDFVVRLYCTFNTNEFSKAMPGGGLNWRIGRLFLITSRINHSCQPNSRSMQTSDGHKVVTAIRNIEEGEELTLRYLDHKLFSRSEWQTETQRIWGFVCDCPGCSSK